MKLLFILLSLLALCFETLQLSANIVRGKRNSDDSEHCYWDGHVLKEGDNQILDACMVIYCDRGNPTIYSCPTTKNVECKEDISKKFPACCC